jgi:3-(methylthio)propanoyl-CoA dehydrogenase
MYSAPLKEIRFVLHRLLGIDRLAEYSRFADYSADFTDSVLEEAAKFAEAVLDPINAIGDREGARWTPDGVTMPAAFREAYRQFVAGGWSQLRAPPEFGGQGAPAILGTAVEELWASANLAFKLCPMLTQGAIEALERCGSQAQRARYLPKMIAGEWTGTMNLTESHAGSDLGSIRTRAVPYGDRYRIHGQKIFITYGDHDYTPNIVHMVLARIDGAPAGTKGISLFVVPKVLVNDDGTLGERNDVQTVSIEHKLGIHASPTCVLAFGDGDGAVGELVGEPNRGLEYMFVMMNAARLSVGLEGYALAERAYQLALTWARTRIQGRPAGSAGGKPLPIVHHPDIKRMLLTIKSQVDAARSIALYGALQLDIAHCHSDADIRSAAQARGELLIPIIKGWSTELAVPLASLGIQIHGGMGFIEETGAAQILRDARITTIYEGTTGIQALDLVGRKVRRDDGAAMTAFIAEMTAELESIVSTDVQVNESRASALRDLDLLRGATENVLNFARQGTDAVQAVAVPYLMLCGLAIGGWLTARAHALAATALDEDRAFHSGKCERAVFYARHIAPQTAALARVVADGADCVVRANAESF